MGNITLMPHNEPAYNRLEKTLSRSNKAIIVSATGTGKSYIAAKYVTEHKEKAVAVCPKRSIMNSWESLIKGIDTMTYQYLCNMKPRDILALPYTCWIFDEAHHCCGPKWQENIDFLMENAGSRKFIGLTADPVRHSDGGLDVSMELFEGNTIRGLELNEAISQGVLPSFTYVSTVFGLEKVLDEAKAKADSPGPNRYRISEKISRLQDNLQNRYRICGILDKHMPEGKRKGVVFVDSISALSEAMDIMKDWAGTDGSFLTIHSQQPASETNLVMEKFREMEEGWVFAIDMLNEGLHFPGVNTVVMFRHTESPNVYFQQIGRGLAANGENPVIFDFVGNRKSLATKSMSERQGFLTGNPVERKAQANVILFDYANEALDILDEIRDLLNGKWTEEEKNILREHYPEEGSACTKRLPGRSPESCQAIAAKLGLKYKYIRPWTPEEDEILKEHYPTEGVAVYRRLQDRTEAMVYGRIKTLGLKRNKFFTDEEDEIIRKYYPTEGPNAASRLPGRTPEQCCRRASALKVKGPAYSGKWTEDEDNILREFFPAEGKKAAERLNGRTESACIARAKQLRLHRDIERKAVRWTESEVSILREFYPSEGLSVAEHLPGRSKNECKNKASILGIKAPSRDWSDEEILILGKYYPAEGKDVAKRLPGRSEVACSLAAKKRGIPGPAGKDVWTEEELAILDKYYPSEGAVVAKRIPAHSVEACKRKANYRGLCMGKLWTDHEIAILMKYYPKEGRSVAKRLENRDEKSCYQKAKKMGLCEEKTRRWTEEEISILKEYYPTEGTLVANRLDGRTAYSCKAKARDLGLSIQPVQ